MKQIRKKVKSLFISDVHLGCAHCKSKELLSFLRSIDPENLYLVGDIIDGWKMKNKLLWTDEYTMIFKRILGMVKSGTKVYYITGNHDEFLRKFSDNHFGHIEIVDEVIHETISGKKLLVIHGDIFDQLTIQSPWLYYIGDKAYSFSMWLNSIYNKIRTTFGFKYFSLSAILKKSVKKAVNFVNNFEHLVVKHTLEKDCTGVICGHIHTPIIKKIENIDYYNCGDWVESCSALIENYDGEIELIFPEESLKNAT